MNRLHNILWLAKGVFSVPDPAAPGSFVNVLERKGRTYVNPDNKHRLRGKSKLRIAKAARVAQRIELFDRECTHRNLLLKPTGADRRFRDYCLTKWRAAA